MDDHVGTVTDPVWYPVLLILFGALAASFVLIAVGALVGRWLKNRQPATGQAAAARFHPRGARPLPKTTRRDWYVDQETPIGNRLYREYRGAVR